MAKEVSAPDPFEILAAKNGMTQQQAQVVNGNVEEAPLITPQVQTPTEPTFSEEAHGQFVPSIEELLQTQKLQKPEGANGTPSQITPHLQEQTTETVNQGVTNQETPGASLPQDLLESVAKGKGPEESLKGLRKKTNEYKLQLEEREKLLSAVTEELEKFRKGEILPDPIKERQQQASQRIAELEKYEKLHALELSPEFHRKYGEPFENLKNKVAKVATDYGVDIQVLNEAYEIDNKRERNAFLREHFDDVGALEVRTALEQMQDIAEQMQQAKTEPARELTRLAEERKQIEAKEIAQRINHIAQNSKSGWAESLNELVSSGEYPEFTLGEDIEHNNKVAKPLLEEAGREYGKFVKALAALGIKEFPQDLAKIIAKRFQLSQASGVAAASRSQHYARAEKIIAESQRLAPLLRPQIGQGTVNGNGQMAPQKFNSPKDAADALLRQVLPK